MQEASQSSCCAFDPGLGSGKPHANCNLCDCRHGRFTFVSRATHPDCPIPTSSAGWHSRFFCQPPHMSYGLNLGFGGDL